MRNTTYATDPDGTLVVTFHTTQILRIALGSVTLNSGGFRTPTTKQRMNAAAERYGLPFKVIQRQRQWFVWQTLTDTLLPFRDGMTVSRRI